jgi:WD40 repeat protein
VWDVADGSLRVTLKTGEANSIVSDVAFSPDGRTLAAAAGAEVWLWDSATWENTAVWAGPVFRTGEMAFSPDGSVLAVTYVQQVWLWDAATGEKLTVKNSPASIFAIAYSPDGRFIATGTSDGNIHLWGVPASG